jgi:PKD repeat protein
MRNNKNIKIFKIILILFIFLFGSITSNSFVGTSAVSGDESNNNELVYPLASKPEGNGQYSTTYITTGIPRDNASDVPARVYYPALGNGSVNPAGVPYPGIVFAPGAGGYETSYPNELSLIASWGYIIAIVGTGGPCDQEVVDIQSYVLDYFDAENANSGSLFYNNIDTTAYGASGHSNGGWAAIAGGVADTRFGAICPIMGAAGPTMFQGQADTRNLHIPLQLVAGAGDTSFIPSSDAYYSRANPIVSYIKLEGSGHGGPFHFEYMISFFRVWLDEDIRYSTFVYGLDVYKDLKEGLIQYKADTGLIAKLSATKVNVYEDEEFFLNGEGEITSVTSENRYIATYGWDLDNDGEFEIYSDEKIEIELSYTEVGEYESTLRVIDTWDMVANSVITITVSNKRPIAEAGPNQISYEDVMIEVDASGSTDTASDIQTLEFMWDFGDGNSTGWSTDSKATHTYTLSGNYTPYVMVQDDDNETTIDSLKVTVVNLRPIAKIFADTIKVEIDEPVKFNANQSNDSSSDIETLIYHWDFGDKETENGVSSKHAYEDEGNYIVTLTVTDDDEETDTDSIIITVLNQIPTCTAEADQNVNEDELVHFTGRGEDSEGDLEILVYSWNFGVEDIPNSPWKTTPEFEFIYLEHGIYTATLTVMDDNRETNNATVKIIVKNVMPNAEFSVSSKTVDEDELIKFDASKSHDTPSDLKTLNYTWDFGDVSPIQYGKIKTHTFHEAGEYKVELKVTDNNNEFDIFTKTIKVIDVKPKVHFTVSAQPRFVNERIIFTGESSSDTYSDRKNLTYLWDFGDDTKADTENVIHNYSAPGKYTVRLIVSDGTYQESDTVEVVIIDRPAGKTVEQSDEKEGSNPWVWAAALNVVLVIFLVLTLLLYIRKK